MTLVRSLYKLLIFCSFWHLQQIQWCFLGYQKSKIEIVNSSNILIENPNCQSDVRADHWEQISISILDRHVYGKDGHFTL
jgi:hypothetical protein